jgi:hypothetical protein
VTEAEWLACTDPLEMLAFLFAHPGYSERKMRLFAVACYWQVAEFHWDEPLFDAEVEAVERHADGLIGRDDLLAAIVRPPGLELQGGCRIAARFHPTLWSGRLAALAAGVKQVRHRRGTEPAGRGARGRQPRWVSLVCKRLRGQFSHF